MNGNPAGQIAFTVKQQPRGLFGLALTQIQFPAAQGTPFDITKFSVNVPDRAIAHKVNGKAIKVDLFEARTRCNGSWVFA